MSARPWGGDNSRRPAAGPRPCEHCGQPVLRQLVGHRAALKVTADAEPLPLDQALALREPNRLVWCLARLHGGDAELRWRCRGGEACRHEAVIEHRCPPEIRQFGAKPEGGLW
ncbi:hypothetical protein ACIQSP_16635 [Streptomyces nigra]|uniref:hypothetical protein n=1 Tax=Streptomyces nigra TaxID=1827580 RepID=UPI0038008F26